MTTAVDYEWYTVTSVMCQTDLKQKWPEAKEPWVILTWSISANVTNYLSSRCNTAMKFKKFNKRNSMFEILIYWNFMAYFILQSISRAKYLARYFAKYFAKDNILQMNIVGHYKIS